MPENEKEKVLLIQLVLMFQTAAMQHLGKLKHPLSEKVERDLEQAQISIDMLDMLHTRMKGNLSAEEERMFANVLQELRLNYVDEASKEQQNPPSPQPPAAP